MTAKNESIALIQALGRAVFLLETGENRAQQEQNEPDLKLLALAEREGLAALFFYFFHDGLPPQFSSFRKHYQIKSARALKREYGLKKLFQTLEESGIPFLPIKGADLACRVYPLPALRDSCDWDILVRKKDMRAFCRLLERDGWICPVESLSDHHLGLRRKGDLALEPHFLLPNLERADESFIWENSVPAEPGSCRRILTPELNLIMLFQHDSINQYQTSNLIKLLLDVAFLLKKEKIDWEKVRTLCLRLHVPHPGLLLHAFPEFFPESIRPDFPFSQDVVATLREMLLAPHDFQSRQQEIEVHESPFRKAWWKRRFQRLTPENLRWKYHLPADCGKRTLFLFFLKDFNSKIRFLLSSPFRKTDPDLQRHLRKVASINDSWKDLKPKQRKND